MKRRLLGYQSRWAGDSAGLKVIEKSRRIGLSWCEAYAAVMHAGEDLGDVYYQSYAKDMTAGFVADCAEWAQVVQAGAAAVGETVLEIDGDRIPAFRLPLANGRQILAMSSAPRAFRSKGRPGDLGVIDEAAFVDSLDEVLKAAMAFRMWGGHVHVISTHNGDSSPFNRLVQEIRTGERSGTLHRVTFDDALSDGLYEKICEVTGVPDLGGGRAAWAASIRDEYGEDAAEELD